MSDLQVFPICTPGGIEQSAPEPTEADLEELKNFGIYRNRVGIRAPLKLLATLTDDAGSGASVTDIIDITEHLGVVYVLSHSTATDKVYLHKMQTDGENVNTTGGTWPGGATPPIPLVVYSSVATKPTLMLTSFTGGTAASPEARLYISDYNQVLDTKYATATDSGSPQINTLAIDFDASGSNENAKFSLMKSFKFHLWGTGFFEAAVLRPEMLRLSQPGTIPGTDVAGGANPRAGWSADHRSVGRRGDKIVALEVAGDRLLVFQKRATHAIYGSGSTTWTRQEVSNVTGAVGPYAVTTVDNRMAYFWASDGPYRTDGVSLQYIGGPIRQLAVEVEASELETRAGYSPDDGLVYFIVRDMVSGEDAYSLALVFDHRREKWMKTQWLKGASSEIEFGALAFMDSAAAPGPVAAPNTLAAAATSASAINVTWVNGDTNVDTVTRITRSATSGGTYTQIAQLGTGVTSYSYTGLSAGSSHFFKIDHYRNGIPNALASATSETITFLATPTSMALAGLSSGLKITGTNSTASATIRIQRSTNGTTFSDVTTLSSVAVGAFTYSDTGATNGTLYYYRARAEKSGFPNSEFSDIVSRVAGEATTAPAAPPSLHSNATTTTTIELDWTDNSDNEDSFAIFESTDGSNYTEIDTVYAGTSLYTRTGLTSNTTYYHKVVARNSIAGVQTDSSASNVLTTTTALNLTAPAGLAIDADATTTSTITLNWTATSGDELKIRLYISEAGGSYGEHPTLIDASAITYTVPSLGAGTSYGFKLACINGSTTGALTSEVTGSTSSAGASAPAAPTGFSATKDGSSTVNLAWTDASSNETGFVIERKVTDGDFAQVATPSANATSHADGSLTAGTTYIYQIKSVNGGVSSAWVGPQSATTDGAASAPTAPSSLAGVGDNSDLSGTEVAAVDLTWTDNSTNEEDFEIERCTGAGCSSYAALVTVPAGTTSYRDTSVTDSATAVTKYRYRVRATNSTGNSAYSTTADIDVEPQCTPSSLVVTDQSACDGIVATPKVRVAWSDGDTTGLSDRVILRSQDGVNYSEVTDNPTSTSYHDDTTVSFGNSYTYKVTYKFGTTGENTGDFTSSASSSISPVDPNCDPLA